MIFGVVMVLAILAIAGTVMACVVRTPGYWKNHPEDPAWASFYDNPLTFAGVTYNTPENTIPLLQTPVAGDKTYNLFSAVIAAWLNYLSGGGFPLFSTTLAFWNAEDWLNTYPPGSGVAASSAAWKQAEPWFNELQAYNSGLRGVPSAD
jgi:hypothetical protein